MKHQNRLFAAILALTFVVGQFAGAKDKNNFELNAHVSSMGHEPKYTQSETGGFTFDVPVFTVKIDGNPLTYQMLGRRRSSLHVGMAISARWKNNGRFLDVQYTDEKGKEKTEELRVVGEEQ